jgi:hypothetical protein
MDDYSNEDRRDFTATGDRDAGAATAETSTAQTPDRVHFETLENRLLLSADFAPVTGSIDRPGEQDAYVFTLTESRDVYIDSGTENGSLR